VETNLFVIKQRGREIYWNCSADHGSGWNEEHPKQSFSPSELFKELRRMIDDKCFPDVEICQLIARTANGPECGQFQARDSNCESNSPRTNHCPT
jgi:hypothetical protein